MTTLSSAVLYTKISDLFENLQYALLHLQPSCQIPNSNFGLKNVYYLSFRQWGSDPVLDISAPATDSNMHEIFCSSGPVCS